jgi:hypothetical protein
LSQSVRRQPTPTMAVGIINSGETIIKANGVITRDGIITADIPGMTTDVMLDGAITRGGTATTDDEGITVDDMTGITTGVMFVMLTVATIINRRFDRISKTFAMHAMKSDKAAGSYAGIIRN